MTPPRTPAARPQQPRRTVDLPGPLVRDFLATNRCAGGPPGATLVYGWLLDAVLRARAGLPLPPAAGAPAVESDKGSMRWTQTEREFQAWRGELRAAGSSVRAVVADRAARYVATGGDAVAAVEGGSGQSLAHAS